MSVDEQAGPEAVPDVAPPTGRAQRTWTGGPFGSWLLGPNTENGHMLRRRVLMLLVGSLMIANLIGMTVAILLAMFIMPGPSVFTRDLIVVDVIVVPLYSILSWVAANSWGVYRSLKTLRWATNGHALTERQQRETLRLPAYLTAMQALVWGGALVFFPVLYGMYNAEFLPKAIFSILLSGLVTCANSYLLSEFCLRPIAARALVTGPPQRRFAGVTVRTMLFWAIGSGVPVTGLILVAGVALIRPEMVSRNTFAWTTIALGGIALAAGLWLTILTTRATTAPIKTLRTALGKVEQGDLDAEVIVFDATELGRLQAGFNDMVAGLRERERVKEIFGRHVGEDVAEVAIASSDTGELGGEIRRVAVLFVDVVGSTRIAATRPPTEVVGVLNRFFSIVVDEVDRAGGFVNKFMGDAVLGVFGAPVDSDDADGDALRAARAMIARLNAEIPEVSAGIGVSAGLAVAGNVGASTRFEYTVIGDPVNEAARLTEIAKKIRGRVAVSMRVVEATRDDAERERWKDYKRIGLRGRTERTRVGMLANPKEPLE